MPREETASACKALTHLADARDELYHNSRDTHGPLQVPLPAPAPQHRTQTRLAPSC